MAALVEGIQYALSSQGNCDDNRALVFVKLTDSAHRAIEDLLKNKFYVYISFRSNQTITDNHNIKPFVPPVSTMLITCNETHPSFSVEWSGDVTARVAWISR
uniref:RNA polymerase II elongation factor ELL N-terminal domain-containing protein n=1 Tax=Timema bartmani TaxID=61472 RepID=A0A7R9F9X0_9NEOP|nr:unnamed protein product [Timema bartmani]